MRPALRIYTAFFLYAAALGGFFPRLGDVQARLGSDEFSLGLALMGTAAGTFVSLTFAGPLIERWGHRRTLLLAIPGTAGCYALASWAHSPVQLLLALLPAGLCIGVVEIIVNLEADRLEHQTGQRLMSRAHACWSIGFFASGLLGAALAQWGWSAPAHLMAQFGLVAALCLAALWSFEPAAVRPSTHLSAAGRVGPSSTTWMLVAACLAAMLMEGASADWSAIYLRKSFDAEPGLAGAGVTLAAGAQAWARWHADQIIDRWGATRVARGLLLALGAGCLLVLLAPSPAWALAGFAAMGLGTSALFPLAMSAAAQSPDRSAHVNVAALAQLAFMTFLAGPPMLGWVASHWGLRWVFGLGLPLVALGWWAASSLAPAVARPPKESP